MLNVSIHPTGLRFRVKVQPRSSHNQVIGETEGVLKVKLTAPPVEGEANQALIIYLAKTLDIPKKDVILIKGETSKNKLIEIKGILQEDLERKLNL